MGQPQKKSKRARKQKDKNSLRQKRTPAKLPESSSDQLIGSDNLNRAYEGNNDLEVAVARKNSRKLGQGNEDVEIPPPVKLSKSQARKAAQVARDKAAKQQRAEVLASLATTELPPQAAQLLHHSAHRGQRPTKRQRLRRDLLVHRLGVDLQEDVAKGPGLHLDRHVSRDDGLSADDSGSDGNESDSSSGATAESDSPIGVDYNGRGKQPISANSAMEGAAANSKALPDAAAADKAVSDSVPMSFAQQHAAAQALRQSMGLGGKLPEEKARLQAAATKGPSRVVPVARTAAIAECREGLPIVAMEQEVMEAITLSDIILLCGETGCGKTTQVPQFLYEAGYGCAAFPERSGVIGVTQPRRVAATSTAHRVAEELGSSIGQTVGFQVRYDRAVGARTAIKFMTDGILMREVQQDFLLRRYSVLVIDEAHERSLNTDLLLGLLSRVVPLRRSLAEKGKGNPLKLIIMSATLRLEDFADNRRLFPEAPPVVRVPARQFPVTLHFARRTELDDYVGAAFKKVSQIHRRLPRGGVLVFLTGQREVEQLCRKLRWSLGPQAAKRAAAVAKVRAATYGDGSSVGPRGAAIGFDAHNEAEATDAAWFGADVAERDDDFLSASRDDDEGELVSDEELMQSGDDEEETQLLGTAGFTPLQLQEAEAHWQKELGVSMAAATSSEEAAPVHVLPLYAALPAGQQARVFQPTPEGHRFIVVATNVAETSLTIPGIRYVVDAGRSKQRLVDSHAGLARFQVAWISQSGAAQRAGRSGRTGPGHCYRLFSSAVFNDSFPAHGEPEIATTALEGVVLAMKALAIDRVSNFPFPSPPPEDALKAAAKCLEALGALDPNTARLTDTGRAMARLPISPRHGRMLVQATAEDATTKSRSSSLPYAILLAAVLSVESPFLHTHHAVEGAHDTKAAKQEVAKQGQRARAAHTKLRHSAGDALSSLNALCAFMAADTASEAFCRDNFLSSRHLKEAAALARQLHRILAGQPEGEHLWKPSARTNSAQQAAPSRRTLQQLPTQPPTTSVAKRLQRALTAGWADQIALRKTSAARLKSREESGDKGVIRAVRYSTAQSSNEVFLHPRSALVRIAPRMTVYTELLQGEKRTYMTGATSIEASWLSELAAPLCALSSPLQEPPPQFSQAADAALCWHDVAFGSAGWKLPRCQRLHPDASIRTACFAGALLGGKLLPAWVPLVPALLSPAATATHAHARHIPRVGELNAALTNNQVDSVSTLAAVWSVQPTFLKRELQLWLQKGTGALLDQVWPQLIAQAATRQ